MAMQGHLHNTDFIWFAANIQNLVWILGASKNLHNVADRINYENACLLCKAQNRFKM